MLPCIQHPLNPTFLPREELDDLDLQQHPREISSASNFKGSTTRPKTDNRKIRNENRMDKLTAPINSFSTPILLSHAASTPFCIKILRRAMKLFNGQLVISTTNPANALHPRSLENGLG
jgi:hypothetical protein